MEGQQLKMNSSPGVRFHKYLDNLDVESTEIEELVTKDFENPIVKGINKMGNKFISIRCVSEKGEKYSQNFYQRNSKTKTVWLSYSHNDSAFIKTVGGLKSCDFLFLMDLIEKKYCVLSDHKNVGFIINDSNNIKIDA